jgi:hypothetical protein
MKQALPASDMHFFPQLTKGEVLTKASYRETLETTGKEHQKGTRGRIGDARTAGIKDGDFTATKGLLKFSPVTRLTAEKNRHPIVGSALRRCFLDSTHNLDTLSVFSRCREEKNGVVRRTDWRAGLREEKVLKSAEGSGRGSLQFVECLIQSKFKRLSKHPLLARHDDARIRAVPENLHNKVALFLRLRSRVDEEHIPWPNSIPNSLCRNPQQIGGVQESLLYEGSSILGIEETKFSSESLLLPVAKPCEAKLGETPNKRAGKAWSVGDASVLTRLTSSIDVGYHGGANRFQP